MSLSDLASIGSLVSGVAVLVSLVFLYFQLRQVNTQVLQAEKNQRALMQQGRSARVIETVFHRLEPHLQEIVARGGQGDLTLDPTQVSAFVAATSVTFMNWEDSYLQHQAGTSDPASWETDEARMNLFLSMPAYRAVWRIARAQFSGAYRDFLDGIMQQVTVVAPSDFSGSWKAYVMEETAKH